MRSLLALLLCLGPGPLGLAGESLTVHTPDGTELAVQRFAASGSRLLIWLPSEHGLPNDSRTVARALAQRGVEVWLAELLESYFLPVQASSLEHIPDSAVPAIIEHALANTHKEVYLAAQGRGAILLLRGLRTWQVRHGHHPRLHGAVLISPNLYIETPDAGKLARYRPIARATNMPLFVLQPQLSPWRWRLEELQAQLSRGGGGAWLTLLPGVRDRFYFRPDATPAEQAMAAELPRRLARAMNMLARSRVPRTAAPLPVTATVQGHARKEASLSPVAPRPAPALVLPQWGDQGMRPPRDLASLHGEVVLVNFWAGWCPPCVHEMPSMQSLANLLQDRPFRILAVNMAEDRDTIRQFLATRVTVSFPILLDVDGAALRRWRVFAFPTSYLIDKKGQIRYAAFGSLAWDAPEVVQTVETLLAE